MIMGQSVFPVGEASEKLAAIGAPKGQQDVSPGQAKRPPGYYVHPQSYALKGHKR